MALKYWKTLEEHPSLTRLMQLLDHAGNQSDPNLPISFKIAKSLVGWRIRRVSIHPVSKKGTVKVKVITLQGEGDYNADVGEVVRLLLIRGDMRSTITLWHSKWSSAVNKRGDQLPLLSDSECEANCTCLWYCCNHFCPRPRLKLFATSGRQSIQMSQG